jgi:hypothetical protein
MKSPVPALARALLNLCLNPRNSGQFLRNKQLGPARFAESYPSATHKLQPCAGINRSDVTA